MKAKIIATYEIELEVGTTEQLVQDFVDLSNDVTGMSRNAEGAVNLLYAQMVDSVVIITDDSYKVITPVDLLEYPEVQTSD